MAGITGRPRARLPRGVDTGGRGLDPRPAYKQNLICDPPAPPPPAEASKQISSIRWTGVEPASTPVQAILPLPLPSFGPGGLRSIPPVHRIPETLRLRVEVDDDGVPTWTLAPGAQPFPHWVERLARHLQELKDRLTKAKANGTENTP